MCVCLLMYACAKGKGKYSVRKLRGIPGNPVDMGIPPDIGRHMALSGPLAGDQSENKAQMDKPGQTFMWAFDRDF